MGSKGIKMNLEQIQKTINEINFTRFLISIRSLIGGLLSCAFTIVISITLILVCSVKCHHKTFDRITYIWASFILFVLNVDVKIKGEEHIQDSGGLILFNHLSLLDIPILMKALALKKTFRFGAKIELFSIPFFGKAMRSIGVLPIARHQRNKVLKIYKDSVEKVKNENMSYALAPEGTRQLTDEIGKFKLGPFNFALYGHLDIYPVVIKGAYDLMTKQDSLPCQNKWKSTVTVQFLPVFPTNNYSEEDLDRLKTDVRQKFITAFNS